MCANNNGVHHNHFIRNSVHCPQNNRKIHQLIEGSYNGKTAKWIIFIEHIYF